VTPEEIARKVFVDAWGYDAADEQPSLRDAMIAALAASEQRGKEGMCPPGWHRIVCDQLQIDALRAQLQASERALERANVVVESARLLAQCDTTFNRDALRGAIKQYDRALASPGSPQ